MSVPEPKLDHLYQEVILDHNKRPRNFKAVEKPTHYSHGFNPLCGDDYYLFLKLNGRNQVEDIGFQGSGCAISKASASMLTSLIKGKSADEIERLKEAFIQFMVKDQACETEELRRIIKTFEGVKEFPVRVKCATIIWRTLEDALKGVKERVE